MCALVTGVQTCALPIWSGLNLGLHTDDDAADVATNRKRLRALAPSEPLWLKQVHGTDVFDADEPGLVDGMPTPVADAAVTASAGKVLAIITADCLTVVLDRKSVAVGKSVSVRVDLSCRSLIKKKNLLIYI